MLRCVQLDAALFRGYAQGSKIPFGTRLREKRKQILLAQKAVNVLQNGCNDTGFPEPSKKSCPPVSAASSAKTPLSVQIQPASAQSLARIGCINRVDHYASALRSLNRLLQGHIQRRIRILIAFAQIHAAAQDDEHMPAAFRRRPMLEQIAGRVIKSRLPTPEQPVARETPLLPARDLW